MITLMYMCTYSQTMQCYAHMCAHMWKPSHLDRCPEDSLLWLCVPSRLALVTTVTQFPWIKLSGREGGNRPWWPSAPPSSGWVGLAFSLKEFWGQTFESRGLRRGMAWPSGCLLAFPCEPHSEPAFTECPEGPGPVLNQFTC